MPKHLKSKRPSDLDLHRNPLIGASKGVTLAGASREDLEALAGINTIEGDLENDTNAAGGIDKGVSRAGHPVKARKRRSGRSGVARKGGKKQIGAGAQAKGAGAVGSADVSTDVIGENVVLSNRDKSLHSDQRGLDSKWVQTEQLQDHAANRLDKQESRAATSDQPRKARAKFALDKED